VAKKKPSVLEKAGDIFKEEEKELTGELFDVNIGKGMVRIKIDKLIPNPNQPRKTFFEQTISELAESIKEHGVLSPIIVRPAGDKYEIVAGERRYKASGEAGLKEIPAIIKNVSNGDARIISLIENIQREDLNDIDRASALRDLKENLSLTWIELGKRLGLSRNRVIELVNLLDLPEEVKEDIRQKKLTAKHGRALRLVLNKPEVLRDSYNFIKEKNLKSNESLELVKAIKGTPGRTIKEAYEKIEKQRKEKPKVRRSPVETVITESDHLIKTLGKIEKENLIKKGREELCSKLVEVQERIKTFIKNLESGGKQN